MEHERSDRAVMQCLQRDVRQRGFTLIELLIVLVIISVVAAGVSLSIGHNRSWQQKMFVEEIAEKLSLAQEYAMLQPANLQVTLAGNHLRFQQWQVDEKHQQGRFVQINDPFLQALAIPDEYVVRLQVIVNKPAAAHESDEEQEKKSAIYISMNGDWMPFTLSVSRREGGRIDYISGTLGGDMTIKVDAHAEE